MVRVDRHVLVSGTRCSLPHVAQRMLLLRAAFSFLMPTSVRLCTLVAWEILKRVAA